MSDRLQELATLIVDTLHLEDVSAEQITRETTFFGDGLGLDSIDILELVVALEARWGVKIDNKELGQEVLASVGSLLDYLDAQVGREG